MRSPNASAERIASLERASKPSTSAEGSASAYPAACASARTFVEIGAALLDLGEDVVAGAVQNSVERGDAVARNPFAQDSVNRNSAGYAGFHREIDAGRDGADPTTRRRTAPSILCWP